jgi:putative endonuclease
MQEVIGSTPIFSTKARGFYFGLFFRFFPETADLVSGFFFMYYTYILYSPSVDKYYVGSTEDLERRFSEHNSGRSPYTKTGSPWLLKWQTAFNTRTEATKLEASIKRKKSRKYIEWLIDSQAEEPKA